MEYYAWKFNGEIPKKTEVLEISDIISWNLWQMDGLKFVSPLSCSEKKEEPDLFGFISNDVKKCPGCEENNFFIHTGKYAKIFDWEKGEILKAVDLLKGR